jgi:hypothetical protein
LANWRQIGQLHFFDALEGGDVIAWKSSGLRTKEESDEMKEGGRKEGGRREEERSRQTDSSIGVDQFMIDILTNTETETQDTERRNYNRGRLARASERTIDRSSADQREVQSVDLHGFEELEGLVVLAFGQEVFQRDGVRGGVERDQGQELPLSRTRRKEDGARRERRCRR